jgi:acyl-CoA thioester hydrolase
MDIVGPSLYSSAGVRIRGICCHEIQALTAAWLNTMGLHRRNKMTPSTECGYWDKMKTCQVAMTDLTKLPSYHRQTIPADYMDRMGHMNVRYYMAVFDAATWRMFADAGLNESYFSTTENGVFVLKQFIQYLAEVRPGETVAVHTRMLGLTDKRIHLMHFMANQDTNELAAIIESLITHANLKVRRAAPLPSEIAAGFRSRLAKDQHLDWDSPVSGMM